MSVGSSSGLADEGLGTHEIGLNIKEYNGKESQASINIYK